MEKTKKIKITDLTDDVLKVEELGVITGGTNPHQHEDSLLDGCGSMVCINRRDLGAEYCHGGAVCTSGVGPCHEQT
ncbi:MAG: hypothetical protein LBH91_03775 [Prevotellaceae bacterium]|jgi:hypothetical protein|nr:hypothetical protein [Prevotellaceae bacterium]